jgi:hydrogenase/urease accessory protein HupE
MRRTASLVVLVALAVLFAIGDVHAHAQPYSFLDLKLESGAIEGRLTAHVFDLAHEIGVATPETLLAAPEAHADTLRRLLARRLRIVADADTLVPAWTSVTLDSARSGLTFAFRAALARTPGRITVIAPLFPYDPQHETYLNVYEGERLTLQELLSGDRRSVTTYTGTVQGLGAVVRTFVLAGIHHIFIGPDHILFVLGLLLLGGNLPRLLKIITAFTLAHSLTLALATLRIVNPPSRVIEPLIALSIVVVGLLNLRARGNGGDARAAVAFGFGLVHGFGFASVLRDFGLPQQALGWSLFSFNLGVELGQATIVLIAAPLLNALRTGSKDANARVVTWGSWIVALAGAYWLIQRMFFAR